MKKLLVALTIVVMASFAFGQTGGGTIPWAYSLDLTYDAGNETALGSVSSADYDAGYIDISNFISTADFDANDSCTVAIKIGSWTLPAAYPSAGNKNDVTSATDDSDFHFKLAGITAADDMTYENSFNALQELHDADQIIMRAIDDDGVQGDGFTADARIDLDWDTDPVGAYSVTVTCTVSQLQ
jgi:hypothetical protein